MVTFLHYFEFQNYKLFSLESKILIKLNQDRHDYKKSTIRGFVFMLPVALSNQIRFICLIEINVLSRNVMQEHTLTYFTSKGWLHHEYKYYDLYSLFTLLEKLMKSIKQSKGNYSFTRTKNHVPSKYQARNYLHWFSIIQSMSWGDV